MALQAQGLVGAPDRAAGAPGLLRTLGAVQLDTISVLARSHELVAYARLGPIGRAPVEAAYWGRPVHAFEGLAHAMCIISVELWPLFAARRRRSARRVHPERPPDARAMRAVLAELRVRGPLTATELGGSRSKEPPKKNVWWHWSAEKVALERLLVIGEVVCVERHGWRRVYDLTERAIPARLRARELDDETCHTRMMRITADRIGVGTLEDLRGHFGGFTIPEARAAIDRAHLIPVRVRGWDSEAWAAPSALEARPRGTHRTTLLSPFDSLIWDRPRVQRIFAFRHKLEAYTPAADRVHGYFTMPVLAGGRLVGRVDPGRDGTTLVAKRVSGDVAQATRIARALVEAAAWVGADDVRIGEARPAALGPRLRSALRALR